MPTRIIKASIASNSNTDLTGGKLVKFTATSDTGAVSTGAVSAARLSVSSCRCYATTGYLDVIFHSTTHPTLASSNTLSGNDAVHAEDFTLSELSDTLITGTPTTIYLKVVTTTGGGNKINFREGCTITLEIDYTLPPTKCTAPSGVSVSSSTSTGANVTLSWKAGGDGTNNAASYYQIARKESKDGKTWGSLTTYKSNVGNVTSYSVPPPSTPGNYYLYFVRLVGTAGTSYASDWAQCSGTLRNPPISSCTAPSGVSVSSSTSHGENVTLSWKAGAGGTHNAASYYEIARKESKDGSTWGDLVTVKTTTSLSHAVPPPVAYGNHYRYYVRLVGAAGTSYASAWVMCKSTLQKVRPALVAYTDDAIEAGATRIKAAHILELRTNVDRLRQGLGLTAYSFTECRAGYTSLARWRAHVLELRAAIDEMAATHEAWLDIPANRPTAAVMQQLRRVVAAI